MNLTDLHRAARAAAFRCRSRLLPIDERIELAYEGVGLAVAEGQTGFGDLVLAGARAIDDESAAHQRHHGITNAHHFALYWLDAHPAPARGDVILHPLAVRQVFAALPEASQDTLLALALHRTISATAAATGVHPETMRRRVATARAEFYALWFEGMVPPRPPTDGRPRPSRQRPHCHRGHEFTPENTYRNGRSGHKSCRACALERSRSRAAS